jgi:ribose/xylose/arabinose/galactoside ABC-type transport system permease subunit
MAVSVKSQTTMRERTDRSVRVARREFAHHAPLLAALIAIFVIGTLGSSQFLTKTNLVNLVEQISGIGVIAVGTVVLMIAGEIDLSIGAAVSVVSIFVARAVGDGATTALVIAEGVAIGCGIGALIGAFVAGTQTQAFIVTLGALSVLAGIAIGMTSGQDLFIAGFTTIGSGKAAGIPVSALMLLGINLLIYLFLYRTTIGRSIFAVGGNPEAARLAGIPVGLIRVGVFVVNGALVGLGAVMIASNVGSGGPDLGTNLELQVIAAVVLGGATLEGGRGSLFGAFLGVLLLGSIVDVLNLVGAAAYVGQIVFGAFIALAIGLRGNRAQTLAAHSARRLRRLRRVAPEAPTAEE